MATSAREKREQRTVSAKRMAENSRSGSVATYLKLPKGAKLIKIEKAGRRLFDSIPYTVGKGNPNADEGQLHMERTYYVHKRVGANEDTFICPNKTFGRACPICEHRVHLAKDPDKDEDLIRNLYPSKRQLWNLIDLDNAEEGVQIFDYSFHLFGKPLLNKLENSDDDEGYYEFADLEKGLSIRVGFVKEAGGGFNWYEAGDIEFKKRAKPYPESIIDKCFPLDEMLIETAYDKLRSIFLMVDDDKEKEDDEPKKKKPSEEDDDQPAAPKKRKPSEEDDEPAPKKKAEPASAIKIGMMVKHAEFGDCEVVKLSADGETITLEDDNQVLHRGIEVGDVKPVTNNKDKKAVDDDEPAPKKKPAPKDEDDEPAPKKKKSAEDDNDEPTLNGIKAGDKVAFEYKGEDLTGRVTEVNVKKKLLTVSGSDDRDHIVDAEDCTPLKKKATAPKEDETDEPAPKKKKAASADVPFDEDDAPTPKKRKPSEEDD